MYSNSNTQVGGDADVLTISHVAMRVYSNRNRHVGWDAVGESCSYEGRTARGTDLWVGILTYRQ